MATRGRAGICTGVGAGEIVAFARLLLLARPDDERPLACLKLSDATPLGRWRGFKLHDKWGRKGFCFDTVTPICPSTNYAIASTIAYLARVLS
jgi:hypothetical protein